MIKLTEEYVKFTVHVHKDWLPLLETIQKGMTYPRHTPSTESILDEIILIKFKEIRDNLKKSLEYVNAPEDGED